MNQSVAKGLDVVQRLLSLFVATALPIVAGSALMGIDVLKSAALAGLVAVIGVVQRLAKFSIDGDLTFDEIVAAFEPDNGNRGVKKTKKVTKK